MAVRLAARPGARRHAEPDPGRPDRADRDAITDAHAEPIADADADPVANPNADARADTRPIARAMTASATARSAVNDAVADHALKNKEARDLESRLDDFDQAVQEGDAETARRAADRFSGAVDDRIGHNGFPEEDAARLRAAADQLVSAAGDLSG